MFGREIIAKLAEIDETLIRSPLTPAQAASAIFRRKAIYQPKNSSRPIFDGMRIMHYQSHDAQSCSLSPSPDG